jgi:DNA-binding NarL/FixJ family response regulator
MHDQRFPHAAASHVYRVLVAASDHRMRAALGALVEAEGCYVVVAEARSPEEAVALDRSLQPALILLDLLFPMAEDGLDAVRLLALGNTRPIVVISAQAALRDAAIAAGAAGFVTQGDAADVVLSIIAAATPDPLS